MSNSGSHPAGSNSSFSNDNASFRKEKKLIVLVDMMNASRVLSGMSDVEHAQFLHEFYARCTHHLEGKGGSIVKYLGDSALAVFDEDAVVAAVDAVQALGKEFRSMCSALGYESGVRCNMHSGDVVIGDFGPQGFRDVMGSSVSATFRLDGGRGINVSERVYRKLPSDARSGWHKRKPPVTYVLEGDS